MRQRLPDRAAALAAMHFPRGRDELEPGRRRLAFEELLLTQLALLRRRARAQARARRRAVLARAADAERALAGDGLPFAPTGDQRARDRARSTRDLAERARRCSGC